MRFRFSRRAEIDIAEIGDYIVRDNPQRALSFVAELRGRCRALVDFPEAYPLRQEFGEGVRLAIHGSYLIMYLVHGRSSRSGAWCTAQGACSEAGSHDRGAVPAGPDCLMTLSSSGRTAALQ
jgi:toxin ParE1/3/4